MMNKLFMIRPLLNFLFISTFVYNISVSSSSNPNDGRQQTNHVLSESEITTWQELQSTWPYRFVHNFIGYLLVIIPIFVIVYLVKNTKYCMFDFMLKLLIKF